MDTLGPRIIDIPHADMVLTFDKRQLLGFVCSSSTSMVLPFHLFFKNFYSSGCLALEWLTR